MANSSQFIFTSPTNSQLRHSPSFGASRSISSFANNNRVPPLQPGTHRPIGHFQRRRGLFVVSFHFQLAKNHVSRTSGGNDNNRGAHLRSRRFSIPPQWAPVCVVGHVHTIASPSLFFTSSENSPRHLSMLPSPFPRDSIKKRSIGPRVCLIFFGSRTSVMKRPHNFLAGPGMPSCATRNDSSALDCAGKVASEVLSSSPLAGVQQDVVALSC